MKKKKRHLTKDEICQMMRTERRLTDKSDDSIFAGLSVITNYVLWKSEHFTQNKLVDFNKRWTEKKEEYQDNFNPLQDLLWNKVGWTIEYQEAEIKNQDSKKWIDQLENHQVQIGNYINYQSSCSLLSAFAVLIDLGYGKKRMERVKDEINSLIDKGWGDNGGEVSYKQLHQELVNGVGIYIN